MKRIGIILLFLFIAVPAFAQLSNGIYNSLLGSNTGNNNYTSGRNVTVLNMPQSCNPPQNLIGRSINQINGMRFNQPVRILHPNEMIPSDYNPTRINIGLDMNGIIAEVHCG